MRFTPAVMGNRTAVINFYMNKDGVGAGNSMDTIKIYKYNEEIV